MIKTSARRILVLTAFACLLPAGARAQKPGLWTLGARYHQEHGVSEEIPFGDGDFSYSAFFEVHEGLGLWQFGVGYAPDVSGSTVSTETAKEQETIDYVVTPEINMLVRDGPWMMGVGMLMSYVEQDEQDLTLEGQAPVESDWTDLYWQLIFGYRTKFMGKYQATLAAYYPFADWGDLGDIDIDDFNYGVQFTFRF